MQINTSGPVIFIDEPGLIDTCHLGATDQWENILIGRWESQTALRVKLTSSRVEAFTKFSSFHRMQKKKKSEKILQVESSTKFVRESAAAPVAEEHRWVHQEVSLHVRVFEGALKSLPLVLRHLFQVLLLEGSSKSSHHEDEMWEQFSVLFSLRGISKEWR